MTGERVVRGPGPGSVVASKRLPGVSNYLIGREHRGWTLGVPRYRLVRYRGVYPGIDLVYRGQQAGIEYDFVVAPGARPGAISLQFEGHDRLEVSAAGDLRVHTSAGVLTHRKPLVYQEGGGPRRAVAGRYVVRDQSTVGFLVGRHDLTRPLVIDPLVYSTFLGGSGADAATAIAADAAGNAYVTGSTSSADFPTTMGALREGCDNPCPSGTTAFVSKFDPGGALVYSTYLGGDDGKAAGTGIAVDGSGNVHVTGHTRSSSFPTTANAPQRANGVLPGGGASDAFLAKLDPAGAGLVYSTYLGGFQDDAARDVTLGDDGSAYVTGETQSPNFPLTAGALPLVPTCVAPQVRCPTDAFVTRFSSDGSTLAYSTVLGGTTGYDFGFGITVEPVLDVDSSLAVGLAAVIGVVLALFAWRRFANRTTM